LAARADAGPLGVKPLDRGADRDLRTVARLTSNGHNLHGAVGDFGNLKFEQAAHELGVGSGQAYLHVTVSMLNDVRDESLHAGAVLEHLARDVLGGQDLPSMPSASVPMWTTVMPRSFARASRVTTPETMVWRIDEYSS